MSDMARDELEDFLVNRDGGLGVVLMIDRAKGNTHTEFEEKVDVSKVTVGNRLEEAVEIGIFERSRLADDHGNAKRYQLTDEGQTLRDNFRNYNLLGKYRKLQKQRDDLEEAIGKTMDRLNEFNFH